MIKFKNLNFDETKNSNCDEAKNWNCDETQKLNLWWNTKTHIVMKLYNSNVWQTKKKSSGDITQNVTWSKKSNSDKTKNKSSCDKT